MTRRPLVPVCSLSGRQGFLEEYETYCFDDLGAESSTEQDTSKACSIFLGPRVDASLRLGDADLFIRSPEEASADEGRELMPSLAEAKNICHVLLVGGVDLYLVVSISRFRNEVTHGLRSGFHNRTLESSAASEVDTPSDGAPTSTVPGAVTSVAGVLTPISPVGIIGAADKCVCALNLLDSVSRSPRT